MEIDWVFLDGTVFHENLIPCTKKIFMSNKRKTKFFHQLRTPKDLEHVPLVLNARPVTGRSECSKNSHHDVGKMTFRRDDQSRNGMTKTQNISEFPKENSISKRNFVSTSNTTTISFNQ
jgi:hypothetical protein